MGLTPVRPVDRARSAQHFGGTPIGASESIVTLWAGTLGLEAADARLVPRRGRRRATSRPRPTRPRSTRRSRDHEIKVFVYNSQNATPDVQRLVDEARARAHSGRDGDRDACRPSTPDVPGVAGPPAARAARRARPRTAASAIDECSRRSGAARVDLGGRTVWRDVDLDDRARRVRRDPRPERRRASRPCSRRSSGSCRSPRARCACSAEPPGEANARDRVPAAAPQLRSVVADPRRRHRASRPRR